MRDAKASHNSKNTQKKQPPRKTGTFSTGESRKTDIFKNLEVGPLGKKKNKKEGKEMAGGVRHGKENFLTLADPWRQSESEKVLRLARTYRKEGGKESFAGLRGWK